VDLAVHREDAGKRARRPRGTRAPREGARERARVCDRAKGRTRVKVVDRAEHPIVINSSREISAGS
jgi:hypothetical protein